MNNDRAAVSPDPAVPSSLGADPDDVTVVARGLLDRLPELTAEAMAQTREAEPAYRDLVPFSDHQEGAERTIAFLLHHIAGHQIAPELADVPEHTGRHRCAQGIPLEAVLHCFRIDFQVVWAAMLATIEDDPERRPRAFLAGAARIWQVIDLMSSRVADAYRLTEQRAIRHRELLLDSLLRGNMPPGEIASRIAGEYGFSETTTFAVICAEPAANGQPSLPRPTQLLAAAGLRSAWCTDSTGQLGIVKLTEGGPRFAAAALRDHAKARVGVGPATTGLAACRGSLWLARAALNTLRPGQAAVAVLPDRLPAAFTASSPELARYLVDDVLGPLKSLRLTERERLLEALFAYLDCQGAIDRTASRLHLHRNTVHQRLRRLQQITGRDLADPRQLTEIVLAAEAAQLIGLSSESA
ncbi:PucR family transcriptional regulator [Streptomyces hygroscopicus]|uniref:PucR family transcriptional regulator n=1 Tax=Streptomyces hygroscopicus TaxID=1912 RepID=UPI00363C0644